MLILVLLVPLVIRCSRPPLFCRPEEICMMQHEHASMMAGVRFAIRVRYCLVRGGVGSRQGWLKQQRSTLSDHVVPVEVCYERNASL